MMWLWYLQSHRKTQIEGFMSDFINVSSSFHFIQWDAASIKEQEDSEKPSTSFPKSTEDDGLTVTDNRG